MARNLMVLLASVARTALTGNGTAVPSGARGSSMEQISFEFDLTVAATDVNDTLDVFVQTQIDTAWIDIVHFAQALGNGGAKKFIAKVSADAALTEFETGTALGAAANRALIGSSYRARWAIVDPTGSNASFTFSVKALIDG